MTVTGASELVLSLQGVTKELGGRVVVDALDLDVCRGELVCILGPSGCGKTTTLRMIAGFAQPDAGSVLIDGTDVTGQGPERRPTAMVFQNYALWPHMTVLRNVTFGLRARGRSKRDADERAMEALGVVGLTAHARRQPTDLSGGEQQRVALARALVLDPVLLLMDEPLSNLDAQLRVKVREELVELQRRTGVTMLFVTHDQDEALSIADRVAVMHDGRLDQLAPPAAVYRDPATAFVAGFVGRVNELEGRIDGGHLLLGTHVIGPVELDDGPVAMAVRPEGVRIGTEPGSTALRGRVSRRQSRGHFDEVLIDTELAVLRSYVEAGTEVGEDVPVRLGRILLYRDGRLAGVVEPARSPAPS